jgi:hypothetical protein
VIKVDVPKSLLMLREADGTVHEFLVIEARP